MATSEIVYEKVSLEELQSFAFETINENKSRIRFNIPVTLDELIETTPRELALADLITEKLFDEYDYINTHSVLLQDITANPLTVEGHYVILDVVATLTVYEVDNDN